MVKINTYSKYMSAKNIRIYTAKPPDNTAWCPKWNLESIILIKLSKRGQTDRYSWSILYKIEIKQFYNFDGIEELFIYTYLDNTILQ